MCINYGSEVSWGGKIHRRPHTPLPKCMLYITFSINNMKKDYFGEFFFFFFFFFCAGIKLKDPLPENC